MTDEYKVYLVPFPGDIRAAVRLDAEGFPSIYINDKLSPEAKKRALMHELKHIQRDDIYNSMTLQEIEHECPVKPAKN